MRLYKTHWWRCNGPCQHQRPFYGMVKRATNRAPGPNDRWWAQHQNICNGTFIKIREPDKKSKKTGIIFLLALFKFLRLSVCLLASVFCFKFFIYKLTYFMIK